MPNATPSLTLALLQAREATMRFFRPQLNRQGLTEQQWRVIRLLRQHGELESRQLAHLACILQPSLCGVLARLERDGLVRRRKSAEDQRRSLVSLATAGEVCFQAMRGQMEDNYREIERRLGEEKVARLLALLHELKGLRP
ncbi:homoprotocatechuate degradation operon regulator HpaR [Pseudomonas panipatensis]|uniref:Homoprotocatechuate degradation operon regulator, HpaR n=1 Tax=Pseudomonas panipatensis TaxID=428992 RepID=A0A1G8GBI6_9PSED|nr:homoprotocatechuate degradation operon regulator HpaR [Pseudomonas panipatensis]SDH91734.1 homoprotocatechuate degradation operon regulator, HpaR [Pseudomonas panipatensis]SMP44371.1 homoprotocatechuate degradation operon regulator, HpaR [Pseudomonas panipatensis]